MKTEAQERSAAAMRQIHHGDKERARGKARIGIWIPGEVHRQIKREARARGITMQERIIEKLRA